MIYVSREKLTCCVIKNESDKVYFDELGSLLAERPSNVVYCEKEGKLYGIVSMGDVLRAYLTGNSFVVVNRRFTSVRQNDFMRAKQIFKENDKINALPVLNDLNELTGAYSRWDDLIAVNDLEQLKANQYAMDFWTEKRTLPLIKPWKKLALVRPCEEITEKNDLMCSWEDYLLYAGVQVSVINREEIGSALNSVECIMFTDEDEKRGTEALCEFIREESFPRHKVKTFDEVRGMIEQAVREVIGDVIGKEIGDAVLKDIRKNVIHVYTLTCEDNGSDYWRMLQKDISDKFSAAGKEITDTVHDEWQKDFFAELYCEEYANKIQNISCNEQIYIDGITKLKDVDTEVYNVKNGERKTLAQPDEFQKCIYFYGPCIIIGAKVADEHTVASFLQMKLNDKGYKVKCINKGAFYDELTELYSVALTKLKKGDIVILYNHNKKYEGVPNINLTDICEKYNVPATWMTNSPLHSNHKLNNIYANEIFEIIEPILQKNMNVCGRGGGRFKERFCDLKIS